MVAVVKLSADDRLDITELPGRYADALDTLQPEQLRDVFTEDAIWEVVGALKLVGLLPSATILGRLASLGRQQCTCAQIPTQ